MKKNIYMTPMTDEIRIEDEALLTSSVLDPSSDNLDIETTTDEFGGEFQSRFEDIFGFPGSLF